MIMLGFALQATPRAPHKKANNEFISQLSNGILSAIIALLLLAALSMLFGYRFIAKELIKIGMKKGDAKAMGHAVTVMIFLTLGAIYLKFFVLN